MAAITIDIANVAPAVLRSAPDGQTKSFYVDFTVKCENDLISNVGDVYVTLEGTVFDGDVDKETAFSICERFADAGTIAKDASYKILNVLLGAKEEFTADNITVSTAKVEYTVVTPAEDPTPDPDPAV